MGINHLTDFPGQGIPVRSHFQITGTLGHALECKATPPRPGAPRAVSKNTQALNCQNEPPLLEASLMPSALQLPLLWPPSLQCTGLFCWLHCLGGEKGSLPNPMSSWTSEPKDTVWTQRPTLFISFKFWLSLQ